MSNSPAPSPSNSEYKQKHVIIPRKAPETPSTEAAKARQSFRTPQELGVAIPSAVQYVVRTLPEVTRDQRMQVLKACEFNMFSFPAALLTCDFLSDSGTSAMTDMQWAALLRGDESYGRNYGYYCLLDAVRDAFERGDAPVNRTDILLSTSRKPDTLIEFFMTEESGGFVNGGRAQLIRPNFFLTPQGRCAEHLLYSTMAAILAARDHAKSPSAEPVEYVVPSNGFFDTTEAHAHTNRFKTVNLFAANLWEEFSVDDMWTRNPFKGNIDIERLQQLINTVGAERIPCILLTVTNNTAAGQPVSMENIRETAAIARKFDIPLVVDACRFAENAAFIHEFEPGYANKSIRAIVKEMMTYFDVCTMSLKKDGLANIGGFLCFRDQGVFHRKFSTPQVDVGVAIKEKQITVFGNDSYGGLSGRDIMAAAVGLHEVLQPAYLRHRIAQTRNFAEQLARRGVPVVLPAGGHAIYLDMNRFLHPDHHTQAYWKRLERQLGPTKEATGTTGGLPKSNSWAEKHHDLIEKLKLKEVEAAKEEADIRDLRGMGFCIELLAEYGIRCCELGPFAFEWDQKTEEQKQGILNLVRFAIPRNAFNEEHINYTVEAISELHAKSKLLPRVRITRGQDLHLRHFQSGLMPVEEQN